MGLIGTIIGGIGSIFGNIFGGGTSDGSRKVVHYAPDKVRVAKIESETKLQLAEKELERIELMRDARLEFIEAQTRSQLAIEEARLRANTEMVNQIIALQTKLTELAEKRILIIEKCSLPIVREIENFYDEVSDKISAANDEYNTKKLPQLLAILRQYDKDSPEHEIFFAQIQDDRARQGKFIEQQMARVSERQNIVLQSFLSTKEQIINQTGQITQQIAEGWLKRPNENLLPTGGISLPTLPNAEVKQLPPADK